VVRDAACPLSTRGAGRGVTHRAKLYRDGDERGDAHARRDAKRVACAARRRLSNASAECAGSV